MSNVQSLLDAIAANDLETSTRIADESPVLLDAADEAGATPILHALYRGQNDIAHALAERKPHPTIFEAASLGQLEKVRERVETDAALANAVSPDGFPLLSLATFFSHFAIAEYLVDRGADVDIVSTNGANLRPIHAAAARNDEPTMRKLLAAGADPNAKQAGGWTALHSAAKHGNTALLDLLLQHHADTQIQSDDGKTPKDLAHEAGHTQIATRLT